ncbi:MarR family winged helix-turn-helix transcriptional regulator [Bradyrhizobium septentrionale]|uniref:MarR family transcriptional regulator n=1 Tax=Bradyrhizobium septentrionale TaxID=1404411 RepID=A0A973W7T3_9BRAD|nr:MarR family transcriptional regulator [Bradyrhizobium septentrionale]UGY17487.1 MarR family transcriptional regulator [Bradyrhizobium septentrionale]UGY26228.1 MarR family transcriptional regulator [Bradyrhizobium septentrionale]
MAKIEPGRCNLTALRKATRRVSQLYDSILATSGLRGTQRAILVYVRRSGSPTMGELAAALVLDRTALNHNLKPLARDGLLTITVDKNDRRSRLVRLTKRGEARLDESQAAWREAQERFEGAFGAKQAADLRQTLELVAALEFGERAADLPAS